MSFERYLHQSVDVRRNRAIAHAFSELDSFNQDNPRSFFPTAGITRSFFRHQGFVIRSGVGFKWLVVATGLYDAGTIVVGGSNLVVGPDSVVLIGDHSSDGRTFALLRDQVARIVVILVSVDQVPTDFLGGPVHFV